MGVVRGVILHASALLAPYSAPNAAPSLRSGADFVLRSLRFSLLRTGISLGADISTDEAILLKQTSRLYSFDCFSINVSSPDDAMHEIAKAWGELEGSNLFVVSGSTKDLCHKLCNYGSLLIVLDVDGNGDESEGSGNTYVKKLEELPLNICRMNKKAVGNEIVTVGYVMKPSRQVDFAKRGALPLCPTQNELMFLPLTCEIPLHLQLQEIDVVLHKATDEIIFIDLSTSSAVAPKITYTRGMQELRRSLEDESNCCVIDPLNHIYTVTDRLRMQHVLIGLEELKMEGHPKIRGPHFFKVDNFNDPNLIEGLSKAKLALPSIVKPQVACGVAEAHSMAVVFRFEDYKDLNVPLPAIVQEYVDHSSTLFKFYALGEQVFHAVKKSMPNADVLMRLSQTNEHGHLLFDSLKSLPTANENYIGDEAQYNGIVKAIDLELVTTAANWLREALHLTIFGFDVVIQEGTGDHVIVDVNYLPSFKEIPDDIAVPAFWQAIRNKFEGKKSPTNTIATQIPPRDTVF